MKTISAILGVFILGLFGWFGFKPAPVLHTSMIKVSKDETTQQKIDTAESYCYKLECKIIDNQAEIETQLNK